MQLQQIPFTPLLEPLLTKYAFKKILNQIKFIYSHIYNYRSRSLKHMHTPISSSSPAVPSSMLTWMPFISSMPCFSHPLSFFLSLSFSLSIFSLTHSLTPSSTTHPLSKHPRGQNKEKELLSSFLITIQPFHCRQATLSLSASQSQRWKERKRERESERVRREKVEITN